eukprot:COSAG05_NODE_17609_length_322_cov_1.179372_1_plen_42_part_01
MCGQQQVAWWMRQQETAGDRSVEGCAGRALPHRVCTVDLLTL